MDIFSTKNLRYPFEFSLLILLLLSLPTLEAPKNILWVLYGAVWLRNRLHDRNLGGKWDIWDSLIFLWISSGYIVSFFSGINHHELRGADDIMRYGVLLWLIKRSSYAEKEFLIIFVVLIISVIVAIVLGAFELALRYSLHELLFMRYGYTQGLLPRDYMLELHSVGHANHSAIYLSILFGAMLSATIAFWKNISVKTQILCGAVLLLLGTAIFLTASRAAALAILPLILLLGVFWLPRSSKVLKIMAGLCIALTLVAFIGNFQVVKKMQTFVKEGNILTFRDKMWNSAIGAWQTFPLFGVGMDNYSQISIDKLRDWHKAKGKTFVEENYAPASHAHSLYFNTLAERGSFGSLILLAVLLYWIYWLIRYRPKASDSNLTCLLWGGAFSAWFISISMGLVNTTLHHEHALLAAIFLGIWLSHIKKLS